MTTETVFGGFLRRQKTWQHCFHVQTMWHYNSEQTTKISHVKKIHDLTIDHSRFMIYKQCVYGFGKWTDKVFPPLNPLLFFGARIEVWLVIQISATTNCQCIWFWFQRFQFKQMPWVVSNAPNSVWFSEKRTHVQQLFTLSISDFPGNQTTSIHNTHNNNKFNASSESQFTNQSTINHKQKLQFKNKIYIYREREREKKRESALTFWTFWEVNGEKMWVSSRIRTKKKPLFF